MAEALQANAEVGVVGGGAMGAGIAQVAAAAGHPVVVLEIDQARADKAVAAVQSGLARAIEKGRLAEGAAGEVRGTTRVADLAGCALLVEAVAEDLAVKKELFARLEQVVGADCVLATNTSSLSIDAIAAQLTNPARLVGMHFFNPAPVMGLVEVVSTVATSEEVAETARALCAGLGKVAVSCGDRAGFIVNALLFPYLNDAVKMLEAHYATADDIDIAMKQGCALPMGPFELLDVVGNDVSLAIQRELYLEFREPGFAPAPLLEHLVTAGYLGRKTQRGFRDYSAH